MSIEIINSSSQTVAANGQLALGQINIRRCDGSVVYNGSNSITFRDNGIYQVIVKVDATATTAAQTLKVALAYNGTVSTVASASSTTTDAGDVRTLVIPKKIRICGNPLTITLVNSDTVSTIYQNLIIDIVKE